METPTTTLQCSNPRCQAINPEHNNFCQKCGTLLKRYLWALGNQVKSYQPGTAISDRYWVADNSIIIDTKPALPPETTEDIPAWVIPYLKLSPYQLHIPQIYGLISQAKIWLLEEAPIYSANTVGNSAGQIMPGLVSSWQNASAMRQLNWLWQIAQLWEPLSSQGVADSLLQPQLLRVEGSLVRLLQLNSTQTNNPSLKDLSQMWRGWIPQAKPIVANFLGEVCQQLSQGKIQTSEQLVGLLDQALTECGRSQSRSYQIFSLSDQGPNRRRNEDSCYPPSGSVSSQPLAIVCDGIGGHEGGDVASSLAIETIVQQLQPHLSDPHHRTPSTITQELENAVCLANDRISERNDNEGRQDRQRMGTTLVMTLAKAHEIYTTHVGDSRVYRITTTGCHQVTWDDDIAAREVRLGYALYRDAVQQPTSGSLVQALGMSSAATLHPTVQRLVVDEDCIFLLCSDGLSDNDRVEQSWERVLVPVLEKQSNLAEAGQKLVEIANTQNGHDNATVGLVYCQVVEGTEPSQLSTPQVASVAAATSQPTTAATHLQPQRDANRLPSPWLLGGLILLVGLMAGVLTNYLAGEGFLNGSNSSPSPDPDLASSPPPVASPVPSVPVATPLKSGDLIKINQKVVLRSQKPTATTSEPSSRLILPAGSLLLVQNQQPLQQNQPLKLQVCSVGSEQSTPSGNPTRQELQEGAGARSPINQTRAKANEVLLVLESQLQRLFSNQKLQLVSNQAQSCPAIAGSGTGQSKQIWEVDQSLVEEQTLPPEPTNSIPASPNASNTIQPPNQT